MREQNSLALGMNIRPFLKKLTTFLFEKKRTSGIDFTAEALIDEPVAESIRSILNRGDREERSIPTNRINFERRQKPNFSKFHYQLIDPKIHGKENEMNPSLIAPRNERKTILIKIRENNMISSFLNKIKKLFSAFRRNILDKLPIFEPEQKLILYWNFVVLLFVVANVVNIPLLLCFYLQEENYYPFIWSLLENVPVWIFLLDILVTLNTSYYSKGAYVKNRKSIFKRYMKKTAMLDMITLFPFFLGKTFDFTAVQTLFLLRIFRIPPLFDRLGEYLELKKPYDGLYDLVKLFFYVFYMAHLFACTWHLLGYRKMEKDESNNWLQKYNIVKVVWSVRYTVSIYWSFTTMITVGYGDVTPANTLERCYAAVIMVLSCAVFAYSLNSVGNIITDLGREQLEFKRKIGEINKYMKDRGVTKSVQVKVKR